MRKKLIALVLCICLSLAHAARAEEVLTIVLIERLGGVDNSAQIAYMEKLLRDEVWIDVKIEIVESKRNVDYAQLYREYIMDHLDENMIFMMADAWWDPSWTEDMFLDSYDLAQRVAAGYCQGYGSLLNEEGTLIRMPTWGEITRGAGDDHRLCVLVKNEVYEAWGEDVVTASDYERLLLFVKEQYPQYMPGVMDVIYLDNLNLRLSIPDLFLPESGYYQMSQVMARKNGLMLYMTDECEVFSYYDIPEVEEALVKFGKWVSDGLMSFWPAKRELDTLSQYATMVTHVDMLQDPATYSEGMDKLDLTGYTMCILYSDSYPAQQGYGEEVILPGYYFVAGKDANVEPFLTLMEWLDDQGNYNILMYGIEGRDYVMEGDMVKSLDTEEDYTNWDYQKRYFYRPDMDNKLLYRVPLNFREETESIEYPFVMPYTWEETLASQEIITQDTKLNKTFYMEHRQYRALISKIKSVPQVAESLVSEYFTSHRFGDAYEQIRILFE